VYLNTPTAQGGGNVVEVYVLGSPGKNLVTDNDNAGCDGLAHENALYAGKTVA
jgi:hypothetical protein